MLAEVDTLAMRLKTRLPGDAAPMQRLRLLNRYFFQELGFAGNVNDYYDAANSYLHVVLHTRRGIPITLALVYMEIAAQIGIVASGISFPGHFLVRLRMPRGDVVIDPFTGQSMSRDALDALLVPYPAAPGAGARPDQGPLPRWLPLGLFLQPAPCARHRRPHAAQPEGDPSQRQRLRAHAPRLRPLVILLPEAWEEWRDRGLVAAELGAVDPAVADLTLYLERAPNAHDRQAIVERLVELGRGDPSRLALSGVAALRRRSDEADARPAPRRQLAALALVAGTLVWLLAPVLTPFAIGAVLAYALHPAVEKLAARRLPRLLAVALVEIVALVAATALILLVVPILSKELRCCATSCRCSPSA